MKPLPVPIPEKLPLRISPCPIVEAVVEMRFVSAEPWRNLPGLFGPRLRQRYPKETELPLAQVPEVLRNQEEFIYQPLLQYEGADFMVRFGPRVLTLVSRTNLYPGWNSFRNELAWLLGELQRAAFVQEGERLGVRYVDFFEEDIFDLVVLQLTSAGSPLAGYEQSFSMVIPLEQATARLVLANGAFMNDGQNVRRGSVLDLDVWHRLSSADFFPEALDRTEHLHVVNKQLFFGLIRPEFLATLNPTY